MKWIAAQLAVLALGLLCAGCRRGGEDETWRVASRVDADGRVVLTRQERSALALQVAIVRKGTLEVGTLRYGRLLARPQEMLSVVAPVAGRIGVPRVALGDQVERGQILAELVPLLETASSAAFQIQLRRLEGELKSAAARLQALRSEAQRLAGLVDSQLATPAARDRAEAEVKAGEAHLAALQRTGEELSRGGRAPLALVATHGGMVVELRGEVGSRLEPGGLVARILSPGPRWLDLAMSAYEAVGTAYRVRAPAGPLAAQLLSKGSLVGEGGVRQDRLLVPTAAQAGLLPGSVLAVEVMHEVPGLLLPESAVVRKGAETLVFEEVKAGMFQPRGVQVRGVRSGVVVLPPARAGGMAPGARVVSVGASALLNELELAGPARRPARASESAP